MNTLVPHPPITADQVRAVAALARLSLAEEEVLAYARHLDAILQYVEQLDELDLTEVEGTTHAVPMACPMRPDASRPSEQSAAILGRAPACEAEHFLVPRIIE
jgi:aspartyl-tRNA(Asn)/glutamyl-tRNA(Gln) amidotransferase subunit C